MATSMSAYRLHDQLLESCYNARYTLELGFALESNLLDHLNPFIRSSDIVLTDHVAV